LSSFILLKLRFFPLKDFSNSSFETPLFSFEKLFKFLRVPYSLKLRVPQSSADYRTLEL